MAKTQQKKAEKQDESGPRFQMVPSGGPIEDMYFDGIAGIVSRGGVVKLDLYQTVGYKQGSGVEMRRLSHRLVMPTTAVPELLRLFQSVYRAVQEQAATGGKPGAKKRASTKK